MVKKSHKKPSKGNPRLREEPKSKSPRIALDPNRYANQTIAWRLSLLDEGGEFGWKKVDSSTWWTEIYPILKDFESMTWNEILSASGGRSRGTNSHPVAVKDIIKRAQSRLKVLYIDDIDQIFSLRLSSKRRIFGIRDGRILRVIWYDPDHKIYPTTRR